MLEFLRQPWPWYVAGPLIGLVVPTLLLIGNKAFGISSTASRLRYRLARPGQAAAFSLQLAR